MPKSRDLCSGTTRATVLGRPTHADVGQIVRRFLYNGSGRLVVRSARGELGWLRGAFGGGIGTAISGLVGSKVLGLGDPALPWLVAPIGASAVLVFAVPGSPLAQPWPVIAGNLLSATIGLIVGHLVGQELGLPLLAAGLAVGLAIAAMCLARCLHPPGGACALLYALGASGTDHWGAMHMATIAANILALAGMGWLYNNLTGHRWPHRPGPVPGIMVPGTRSAAVHQALSEVLAEWDEVIDADIEDLDAIFQAVERRMRKAGQDAPPAALI